MDRSGETCGDGNKKGKWKKMLVSALSILILAAAVIMLYRLPFRYGLSGHVTFSPEAEVYSNPLTGFAPMGDDPEKAEQTRLVYILLTWREWEPREGQFDVKALEERYQIGRWKGEGKNAVLRFVCDIPGNESHMDIPDWLYERTGDGTFYDTDYGMGYAPVYENTEFMEAHEKALQALGEYCSKDTFVSYVQLGSLGHWGEWHTKYEDGVYPMPDEGVCWEYAGQYQEAFPDARLLMRRNYTLAIDGNMGVYNDMTGMKEDTEEWLRWMSDGGAYEIPGRRITYKQTEKLWNTAPIGGEFTSGLPMEYMLEDNLEETLSLIESSHMTFIGPKCPEINQKGAGEVLKSIGYCYYIESMDIRLDYFNKSFKVKLIWENSGAAPIYFQWPVMFYVLDKEGEPYYSQQVDLDLRQLYPGMKLETENRFVLNDSLREGYTIGLGIINPASEMPDIELGMQKEFVNGINLIYTFDGSQGHTLGKELK